MQLEDYDAQIHADSERLVMQLCRFLITKFAIFILILLQNVSLSDKTIISHDVQNMFSSKPSQFRHPKKYFR